MRQTLTTMLSRDDLDRAVDTLADAFSKDQLYKAIFPDPELRRAELESLWHGILSYGLLYGEVYTTPDIAGVSCWLPPGRTHTTALKTIRSGLWLAMARMGSGSRKRFLRVMKHQNSVHKEMLPEPHYYLLVLGVRSDAQGRGLGSTLMAPVLDKAASEGLPVYLEAVTKKTREFYSRKGFEVVQAGDMLGIPVKCWAMLKR